MNHVNHLTWFNFETFAKRPFLPNLCACPMRCKAYFIGVKLNILQKVELYPRNTLRMDAWPDVFPMGAVKNFVFFEFEQN